MDKQDKIYVFITGMLLLLMATFASCAKADQQGFDEFVSRANAVMIEEAVNECYHFNEEATLGFVKMMIKNKHPEWLKK